MARVLVGGVMVTQRLTGGDYEQDVRLLMFERSEWDADEGLFVARLQLQVEAVDPIEACTQVVHLGTLEHEAAPVVPIGIERVAVGDTLEVGMDMHGLAGAITATSDDTGTATVTVASDGGDGGRQGATVHGRAGDGGRQGARHRGRADRRDAIGRAARAASSGAAIGT